ncbi:chalcone isomerase family protein [Aliikangiella coralliicola]|uniref:Chalcone isomerase domain-containing protein n=1 Tax=Aliikangiella coralliicola TaxID=2592383 RepID=A0A545UJT2_9GAMM|nr:chalcone isomerase family protein [Aliikangiella coralliicola]TQV89737.1 hypothetical protein FLL46_02325 [Aliikangiella coralliicola]
MKRIDKVLMLTLILLSTTVWSTPTPPENLKLVGKANLTIWFWDIYDAELYSSSGQYQSNSGPVFNSPLLIKISYNREISRDDLIEETASQWERFNIDDDKKLRWLKSLGDIWPDVDDGDKIMFHIDNQGHCHFFYNEKFIGSVNNKEFSFHFANIWLKENGPYPKMTKRLTGKKSN